MNTNKYWKPDINDEIKGILVDKLDDVGKYHNKLYQIQTSDELVNVWGKKQLDNLMKVTKIGDKILIRYMGTKKVNDYQMNVYQLELLNDEYC